MPVLEQRIAVKNILYATDFSRASEPALRYTLALAQKFGSSVTAVHVVPPSAYGAPPPELFEEILDAADAAAQDSMRTVDKSLRTVRHKVTIRHGDVCEGLAQFLATEAVDMIVVGTADRTGVHHALDGSVAEEIVRTASCPVLTVGINAGNRRLPADLCFDRILYATDFSVEPSPAAAMAFALAEEDQAKLILMHVADVSGTRVVERQRIVTDLHAKLRDLLPPGADMWCRPETIVEFGDPAQRIAAVASEMDVDMVVMTPHASKHPRLAAHGSSTVHRVLTGVGCPVLTLGAGQGHHVQPSK